MAGMAFPPCNSLHVKELMKFWNRQKVNGKFTAGCTLFRVLVTTFPADNVHLFGKIRLNCFLVNEEPCQHSRKAQSPVV